MNGIMMNKTRFCSGILHKHSSWDHYWEGKLRRNNANWVRWRAHGVNYMANYGITDHNNVMAAPPTLAEAPLRAHCLE